MEPEPEPEPARAFSVADTPTGQTGFAVLIIDASAGEEEESLLFQYQNEAMQWDVSRVRGQLEALLSITGDALSQPATVADLRLKTARGGEDLVKAAFRTVKMAKGEAIVVFLYQVNVVRGEIARPTMQVLAAAQLMSDDELREAMPADLFPRPLANQDKMLFGAVGTDQDRNLPDVRADETQQKYAASAVDENYRTLIQVADDEGRSKTRAALEGHIPLKGQKELPDPLPNNPYKLARGLHWVNAKGGDADQARDKAGRRRRAMRLPPDGVLLTMIDSALSAIVFELGPIGSVLNKRATQVQSRSPSERPPAGRNDLWIGDWSDAGACVGRVLEALNLQYFGESPRMNPPCAPSVFPEATVFFASPDEARSAVSAELTLLETASRDKAREISLDARTTDPLMSVFFHKGLLIDSHCPPALTRSIAGYCRMQGWLQRTANAPERLRDPGDECDDSRPVFVEQVAGKFEQRDLVILAVRHDVLCLVVSRRTPKASTSGELQPFYVDQMRETLLRLSKSATGAIDKAIGGKAPLTLMDGRSNDGVYESRRVRDGELPRPGGDTSIPSLTSGAQNVLLFLMNYDAWSGCVIMRPGPETYPVASWKDELRSEFYSACATIRGTLHAFRGMGMRTHAAAVKKSKLKKTTNGAAWPLNHYKLPEDPAKDDWPAKKGAGDAPVPGTKGFAFQPPAAKRLPSIAEFGLKITLSGAGSKGWSELGPAKNRETEFPAEQGLKNYREKYPPPAGRPDEPAPQAPPTKAYRDARPGLDDAWPLSFWVVGYLLPPDRGQVIEREFYVCYQEDIPQNVAELAYKVNFGLQI